jgi:hypothetical protein
VKGAEVHEWETPTIPSLRRSGGRGDAPVLHREHEDAARENAAGRVMLQAYRRGAGHRVQGLR